MKIREDKIENFKKRISELNNVVAEKKAKRDILESNLKKCKGELKGMGFVSIKDARLKVKRMEEKYRRLMESIDKGLSELENKINSTSNRRID